MFFKVEAAWRLVKYDPLEHGDLAASRAAAMASEDVVAGNSRAAALCRGDAFLFNTRTGELRWDVAHHKHLLHRQEKATRRRFLENERKVYVRELREMAVEDEASRTLRVFASQALGQWEGHFGGRLPFKHAGR